MDHIRKLGALNDLALVAKWSREYVTMCSNATAESYFGEGYIGFLMITNNRETGA